ncbi:MAG: tetratricopeptide repeat protein, partial [Bacteroidales bacterium]|nr:tetratricopeptide repeat protein [Bacteroidales bacterium]
AWYKLVDRTELDSASQAEYYFKIGYCYYSRKEFDNAAKSFYETKDRDDLYGIMSLYFYSHIKYTNEQYQTALNGFLKLKDNPTFASIVPFYILQIYYMQTDYQAVVDYANESGEELVGAAPENAKIVGISYMRTKRYAEAIPYLKKYMEANSSATDFDYYELAYAQYQTGAYEEAAKNFGKIQRIKDTIGQNAAYLMGDCYLKLDKKMEARRAFETASLKNFNPAIKEDALFNFAQLSFELSLSPFNEAISAFTRYIQEYPESPRTEYAYDYLLDAFMSAKNYQRAIATIEDLPRRNSKIDMAYQRLTYIRGQELFVSQKYTEAIEMFNKSIAYGKYNKNIESLARYWKAESNYRVGNVDVAIDQFKEFVNSLGSITLDEYSRAHYNLGYAYFEKKSYSEANTWFRKYENMGQGERNAILNDTYNRIADCYYINREFAPASEYYKKAVGIGLIETDYSLYQLSLSYGGQKKTSEKVWALQRLLSDYPNSEYASNAMFEIARSYQIVLNQEDSAKQYYEMLIAEYPYSSNKSTALSSLGAIEFNRKHYDNALGYYKQVVSEFPGTEDAQNANSMIKNIYLELDKPDVYIEYATSEGSGIEITQDEQDEITWLSAKKLYIDKKYNEALSSITKYLNSFPKGKYVVEGSYYKAELHFYFKQNDDALASYRVVADAPTNSYSEESANKAASILFDKENWTEACKYYDKLYVLAENKSTKLIAALGSLRCSYNAKNYDNVISAATKVVESDKSNEEQVREAYYKMARAYFEKENMTRALGLYEQLSQEVISYEGAEAKYMTSLINYNLGNDSIAEEIIYEFAQSSTPYAYWLAKSYILLAQIYFEAEDIFSAKYTLQSVLSNYDVETDGIKDEASEKLSAIYDAEENARQEEEMLKLNINLIDNADDEGLFPDEELNIEMPDDPIFEESVPEIELEKVVPNNENSNE